MMEEYSHNLMKSAKPLLSRWLPVVLWAAVIFIFSSNPDPYSLVPNRLYHWLWWTKLFGQSLFFYLGGLTHILEYAILAYLLARALLLARFSVAFCWRTSVGIRSSW